MVYTRCPPPFLLEEIEVENLPRDMVNGDLVDNIIDMREAIDRKNAELRVLKQWHNEKCK